MYSIAMGSVLLRFTGVFHRGGFSFIEIYWCIPDHGVVVDSIMPLPLFPAGDTGGFLPLHGGAHLQFQITACQGRPNLGIQLEVPAETRERESEGFVVCLKLPAWAQHCSRRSPFTVVISLYTLASLTRRSEIGWISLVLKMAL